MKVIKILTFIVLTNLFSYAATINHCSWLPQGHFSPLMGDTVTVGNQSWYFGENMCKEEISVNNYGTDLFLGSYELQDALTAINSTAKEVSAVEEYGTQLTYHPDTAIVQIAWKPIREHAQCAVTTYETKYDIDPLVIPSISDVINLDYRAYALQMLFEYFKDITYNPYTTVYNHYLEASSFIYKTVGDNEYLIGIHQGTVYTGDPSFDNNSPYGQNPPNLRKDRTTILFYDYVGDDPNEDISYRIEMKTPRIYTCVGSSEATASINFSQYFDRPLSEPETPVDSQEVDLTWLVPIISGIFK